MEAERGQALAPKHGQAVSDSKLQPIVGRACRQPIKGHGFRQPLILFGFSKRRRY